MSQFLFFLNVNECKVSRIIDIIDLIDCLSVFNFSTTIVIMEYNIFM